MNSNRQPLRSGSVMMIVIAVFFAGYALGNHTAPAAAQPRVNPRDEVFDAFWETYETIREDFVNPTGDTISEEMLVDGAIRGLVDSLGDPNSVYLAPDQYDMFNEELSGSIEGIGVVIQTNEEIGGIEVVNVLEGTPAAQAGVRAGDVFAVVDGEDVLGMNQLQLSTRVRGEAGSVVEITMLRDGDMVKFSIVRDRIDVPNIDFRRLENSSIGYIRLYQFTGEARDQIDSALSELNTETLDGLILDFRGNPGGLLSSAIEVASAFIEDGDLLIEDFGDDNEQVYTTNGSFNEIDLPLVILVDERSASASELVAGAMQDSGVATIIGEVTFGKGTVQNIRPLRNGGGLRLTIARWLTPNRNWIHGTGIVPDIVVDWESETVDVPDDPQLQAAVDFLGTLVPTSVQETVTQ